MNPLLLKLLNPCRGVTLYRLDLYLFLSLIPGECGSSGAFFFTQAAQSIEFLEIEVPLIASQVPCGSDESIVDIEDYESLGCDFLLDFMHGSNLLHFSPAQ